MIFPTRVAIQALSRQSITTSTTSISISRHSRTATAAWMRAMSSSTTTPTGVTGNSGNSNNTTMTHQRFSSMATATSSASATTPAPATDMFCRQCEQTAEGTGCVTVGVCGKTSETAAVQDTLIHQIKQVAKAVLHVAGDDNNSLQVSEEVHVWTLQAAFATLTNVNFSQARICEYIRHGAKLEQQLLAAAANANADAATTLDLSQASDEELEIFGHSVGVLTRQAQMGNDDCFSLNEVGTYGLKGASAYAAHCHNLGFLDEDIMNEMYKTWAKLDSAEPDMGGLLSNALGVGAINAKVLAMLDDAHAKTFGIPEPTEVRMSATEGKAILISGHDLGDLKALLEQTEGTGINVYTHGEMLPAHSYPELKKYKHLVGNYGTAWQNQKFEFASFPGPIIVTTNCILEPRRVYKKRIFTMNEVGVDGVQHIGSDKDFSKVIEAAHAETGFPRTIEPPEIHTVGFNHRAVLPLAGDVIDAVQQGALSRIVLIGGCDGSQWDRNYFTDLAEELPDDTLILTLGCAKNRFIRSEKLLGQTLANGMPRIMDMGQCNDSYSAVVVATELAKALNCSVNELPLSLALSHLEQKAAAVLLTLLDMGVQNIRLGPSLPAYVTPNVLNVLVENYNIMPTTTAKADVASIMAGK